MKTKLLYISIVTVLLSCKKSDNANPILNQEVVFQIDYVNGFTNEHCGLAIDSAGIIWKYNNPANWNYLDSENCIESNKMKENLQKMEITSKIEKDVLLNYYRKLCIAASGELTEPRLEGYDIGILSYMGFIYDLKTNKYKQVLIKQSRSVIIENKSKEASDIYNWLTKFEILIQK